MSRARRAWLGWGAVLLLSAFVAALAVGELVHHDFACHLKTPTHCTACTSAPAASVSHSAAPDANGMAALGVVPRRPADAPHERCASLTCAGRAPPAFS